MSTRRKRILSDEKGAYVVEFALVVPIFFLLLFAIFDFGWYFFTQHTIQYATREGTRLATVDTRLKDESGNEMSRIDSIIKKIKDNAALAVDPDALNISIYPIENSSYSDPTNWETTQNPGTGGQIMRVRVRYTYTFFTPFIGNFFSSGQNVITAQALFKNEGF